MGRIPKTQLRILQIIEAEPNISMSDLSKRLGISKLATYVKKYYTIKNRLKLKQYCPNCFALGSRVKCPEGYICTKCGMVFEHTLSIANEKFWRQPINALQWNFNKGLDGQRERRLLLQLRKYGVINDLTTWDLSKIPVDGVDDAFTKWCLGCLQVRFHHDDWALTHAAGLLLRQKIKRAKHENEFLTEALGEKLVRETLDEIHKIAKEAKIEEDKPKKMCDEINFEELIMNLKW